ncbi:MAG: S-layer homology domain-containing protein [Clostridia bacterium]|nr:S-layer homology domain-containing protein [Clostridia bacterium]
MRNLKKFLALVLAMIMVVSAAAVVSADFTDVAADSRYAAAINDLAVKGIVKGTSETTFGPEQDVTRWQMALFVARSITGEVESDDVWANGIVPFTDVTSYKGAIQCAYLNGIINGTSATTFAPNDGITYVAALKMAVCALGYGEGLEWPWGYYNKAAELGLTANMDVDTLEAELNRAETAQIIYNMIYAAPADGGKTFAAENFSIAAPENTTLFAITATPKQYYYSVYKSGNDVGENLVGLQKIVNGIPSGAMLYVTVESIGLTKDNVEDYFNYAVELINYDEETGAFTGYIMGDAPKTLTHKDVTIGSSRIKYDGVNYSAVDQFTGSSLLNEVIVYETTNLAETAKLLLTNKDGDIIDGKGNVLATFAYESATGAKYYYDVKYEGISGAVITEATALSRYGVIVADSESAAYVKYNARVGSVANGLMDYEAFELKVFDDDRDGKFERAYYSPIYMSVYYTYKATVSGKEQDCDGMLATVFTKDNGDPLYGNLVASNVTYTDAAAKKEGAVSVFTYNAQLNKVNVIDVLEMQTGYIERVNSTGYSASGEVGKGAIKITIDGTVYQLGYDFDGKWETVASSNTTDGRVMGATLVPYDAPSNNSRSVEAVADRPFISYVPSRKAFIDDIKVDDYVGFYAYNGYIIYISELEIDDLYDFAVVEEFADFDLAKIYLDLWIGGELEKEALVTEIDGKELEDLSSYKFSMLLSEEEYYYPGTIYAYSNVEDAYNLREIVDEDNYDDYDLIDAKYADDNYIDEAELAALKAAAEATDATDEAKAAYEAAAKVAGTGIIAFDDGTTTGVRANRLRTSSSTVFYFIEDAECDCDTTTDEHDKNCDKLDPALRTVSVFQGQPDDAWIKFNAETNIWVDALGHGTADTNGRASVVFVINPDEHYGFFGLTDTVYVYTVANADVTEIADAQDLGLPEEYDGVYYEYANKAINLDDGSKLTVYSKVKLGSNRIYKVDENGVVYLKDSANLGNVTLEDYADQGNHYGDVVNVHWMKAPVVKAVDSTRNYVKYGITDVVATGSNSTNWGAPNNLVTYSDYLWYTKATDKKLDEALDDYAELLEEIVLAVVAQADAEAEIEELRSALTAAESELDAAEDAVANAETPTEEQIQAVTDATAAVATAQAAVDAAEAKIASDPYVDNLPVSYDKNGDLVANSVANINAVEAFLAPYIAAESAGEDWEIEFEEIPKNVVDVELNSDIVYAEYVDDYVVVDLINYGGKETYSLISESDRVTDILVVIQGGTTVKTGEEAIEILNSAPQVAWVGTKGADDVYGQLFKEYLVDGVAVFMVGYTNNDK